MNSTHNAYWHLRAPLFFFCFFVFLVLGIVLLRIVIGPFILAMVLAYVLNPFIEVLEKRGFARSLIVISVLLLACIVTFLVFWLVTPLFIEQLNTLVHSLPRFRQYIEANWLPWIDSFFSDFKGPSGHNLKMLTLGDVLPNLFEKPSQLLFENIGQSTRYVASWLVTAIISPVFAFFVMRDFRTLMYKVMNIVPPDLRGVFIRFIKDADHTLRAVLRGQILVIGLLSILYSTAFVIAGLPAGLAVGIITGFARLVPYLDIVVGGSLCFLILVTSATASSVTVGVIIAFLAIQLFDGIILTPRIMGQFSGLHPFLVVLSVLCFGDWFGFYGVLLAIPMAALGRVTFETLLRLYKRSRFFTNRPGTLME